MNQRGPAGQGGTSGNIPYFNQAEISKYLTFVVGS